MSPLNCPYSNTNQIMPSLYNLQFTDIELDTIANAMEDYMQYDDEKLNTEFLFGGLSVSDRVNSIQNKIDKVFN